MKDINELSEDEQIEYIKNDKFYYFNLTFYLKFFKEGENKFIKEDDSCVVVGNYYISLIPQGCIEYEFSHKLPLFFIRYIKNPSERAQLEVIKNINYNNFLNDELVNKYINSEKALDLYKKIKTTYKIIS